jgi:hypothetical protein
MINNSSISIIINYSMISGSMNNSSSSINSSSSYCNTISFSLPQLPMRFR